MNCADCGELLKERESRTWCWECGSHMHSECAMLDADTGDPMCETCFSAQAARDEELGRQCDQLEIDLARGKHLPTSPPAEQFEATLAATDADDVEVYTDAECPDLN